MSRNHRSPLVLALILASGVVAAPGDVPVALFMPAVHGMEWVYQDRAEGVRVRVEGRLVEAGTAAERMVLVREDRPEEFDVIETAGGRRRLLRRRAEAHGFLDFSDDPLPLAAGPHGRIGDRLTATPESYTNPITGGHLRYRARLRGFRDVTTMAGIFPGCLRLEVRMVDTATGTLVAHYEEYLAPGVGRVQVRGMFLGRVYDRLLTSYSYPWQRQDG